MPEFQIEQYMSRVDRELVDVSGLNDLMRGMAPTQVMSSGKAVAALVSNYETRMTMPRDMYYQWRQDNWDIARTMFIEKMPELKPILEGTTKLYIESPSLTPRDDAEMSTIALNMKEGQVVVGQAGDGPHRRGRPRGRAGCHPRGADRRDPQPGQRAGHGLPDGDDAAVAAAGCLPACSSRVRKSSRAWPRTWPTCGRRVAHRAPSR